MSEFPGQALPRTMDIDVEISRPGSAAKNTDGCLNFLIRLGQEKLTWMAEFPGQARPRKIPTDERTSWSGSAGKNRHGSPNFPARHGREKCTGMSEFPGQARLQKIIWISELQGWAWLEKMDMDARISQPGLAQQKIETIYPIESTASRKRGMNIL